MFGYINATKEQLGEDYETFCAYYCGLCKQLGKSCSHSSRLGLSYDITFLAIILSSVIEEDDIKAEKRCVMHPVKKRLCVSHNKVLDYCAKIACILSYEKCRDDWNDEKSIKAILGMAMYRRAYLKAQKSFPEAAHFIQEKLSQLSRIECENIKDIDMAADSFAQILSMLFSPKFIEDNNALRQLEWFGYNVGRWIYIIDAINDLRDDYKNGAYNALLQDNIDNIDEYYKSIVQKEEFALTFTLENIASTFDLMKLYKNSELLKKMIYISLPQKQIQILEKSGGENGSL